MRLFLALELPEAVREAAAGICRELKASGADVKWVPPENLHVTLKFLGETDGGLAERIKAAMADACAGRGAMALSLDGAGAFPGRGRPQVVWLGLGGEVEPLAGLAGALEQRLEPLGFAPERRPFAAHVTLGRLRRGRGKKKTAPPAALVRAIASLAGWRGPEFSGRRVSLMQSELTPAGARYQPLHQIDLP